MKKLLTIALLTLSPFTFAKDFNPDLLIGTWQCQGTSISPIGGGTEIFIETFKKDGTIESENVIRGKFIGQKITILMHTLGKWKVENDFLFDKTEKLLAYHSDNEILENKIKFGESFKKDKKTFPHRLVELTTDRYRTIQSPEIEKIDNIKSDFTCNRVKQLDEF